MSDMSEEGFEQFRQLVLEDVALQDTLRETADREAFIALVVRLGEARGCSFTAEAVQAALRDSRRVWLERWIEG